MSQEEIDKIYAQLKLSEELLKKANTDLEKYRRTLKRSTAIFKVKLPRTRK